MIETWLVAWQQATLPVAFFVALCLHLTVYLGWGGVIAIFSWLLREKVQQGLVLEERPFYAAQLRTELLRGATNCAVISLITLACLAQTNSAVPSNVGWLALELVGLILFYDPVFYFLHRLLHTKHLRAAHGIHHKSVRPTPWSGLSVHPIEAVFIELPILLFVLVFPTSVATLVLFQIVLHYFSSVGHANFDPFGRLSGFEMIKSMVRWHQAHHSQVDVNFTAFLPFWDKIFKTHAMSGQRHR